MKARRVSVLVVATKYWPLAARLAIVLLREGWRVTALCPPGHPLRHVRGIERVHRYGGLHLAGLRRAIEEDGPELIVPCDDGVVAQLHALHGSEPTLRTLIESSLGTPVSYPIIGNRFRLLELSGELGIFVPKTIEVVGAGDLVAWHREVASAGVLKLDGSCGGLGVRVSRSIDDSMAAWRDLAAPENAITACKRLIVDRDALSLWAYLKRPRGNVTIQEFIAGRPANSMLACLKGRLISLVSVAVVASEGATGAATVVRPIKNEAMARAARLLTEQLGLTGFFGLDFMIEGSTGTPYLIEMNPRCTQLGHMDWPGQTNLVSAFCAAWIGEQRPATRRPIPAETVAIFPQALTANLDSSYLQAAYLDVPWEEPGLVRELLSEPWPHRRWLARLYHALRPLHRSEAVSYESALPIEARSTAVGPLSLV